VESSRYLVVECFDDVLTHERLRLLPMRRAFNSSHYLIVFDHPRMLPPNHRSVQRRVNVPGTDQSKRTAWEA
jgi:hypothetical protein